MLWFTAVIWGAGFVAQSTAMHLLEPNSFNAARFILAAITLTPLLFLFPHKREYKRRVLILGGMLSGTCMFAGFSFQQTGLLYITAGDAGFISSVYIVIVPVIGLTMGHKTHTNTWLGVLFAIVGLYYLSVGPDFSIQKGDVLELIGAFFWAADVLIIGYLSRRLPVIPLAITQFSFAALLAITATLIFETPTLLDFTHEWIPILYAGIVASSIATTLQILGQRDVPASMSALILSTEALFAVIADWLILDVSLTLDAYVGSALILTGMLISQWPYSSKSDLNKK